MPAQQAPNILEVSANKQKKLSQLASHIRSTAIFFIRSTGEFPKSLYAVNLLNAEDGGKHFFRAELLHLKAGGVGKCPILNAEKTLPSMLILLENKFAVLIDEKYFAEFEEKVLALPEIETIFIIPDSNDGYISMIQNFRDRKTRIFCSLCRM